MGSDGWTPTTLGECARWVSGGTPSKKNPAYWGGAMPWVSAKDMKQFRLYDSLDHVTPEALGNGTRSVPPRSILLLVRGMTLHDDLPICMVMREMTFNQDVKALVPNEHVVPEFLAYWLLANKQDLLLLVDSASHGTGRIHTHVFKDTVLRLPSLRFQQRIADVLGALDDRIELNRRMNRTLEKMAAAIFKSWFIDFDPTRAKAEGRDPNLPAEIADLFPDRLEDSELGLIPKGWKVALMKDLADVNARSIKRDYPHARIRYADISSVSQGSFDQTTAWDLADAPSRAKRLVQTGDTIWSCVRPNRKAYLYIDQPADNLVVSTGFAVLSPSVVPASYLHQWVTTQAFVDYLTAYATGAAYPAVKADTFETAKILRPDEGVLKAFHDLVGSLRVRIAHNQRQNRRLAGLRDTLLPKLLSGEIELPAAEILAEEGAV